MAEEEEKIHPKDKASFISRVTLWWIFRLLWQGSSRPLQAEDLHSMQHEDRAEYLTKRLRNSWDAVKNRGESIEEKPALWRVLLRFFSWKDYGFLILTGSLFLIAENVVWFCTIKLLYLVGSDLARGLPESQCSVYIYGIAIGQLVKVISQNHFQLHGSVLGIRARAAIVGLLYKKILSVSKAFLPDGHVMELVSDDSQRLVTSGEWFLQDLVRRLLSCVCAFVWLFYFVGWQVLPGSLFLLSLGFYRALIANTDYNLRTGTSQLADKRLGYIREMLTGIRSVKLNCLEEIFERKIRETRWQEIKGKAKRWLIVGTFYPFLSCGQQLATFLSIILLVFTNTWVLSYQTVFTIMVLFGEICAVFSTALPTASRLMIDVYRSLERIQDFLESDDHVRDMRQRHSCISLDNISEKSQPVHGELQPSIPLIQLPTTVGPHATHVTATTPRIYMNDVTCKLPALHTSHTVPSFHTAPVVNYVTLEISEPQLVVITGPVGSGKSSLLKSVLDCELLVTNGLVQHSGSLAYVSDSPWVFSGTIRENILFGLEYDQKRYLNIITACQLDMDLQDFPKGDLSRIGEHGATVSGGQRARIALARAVYSNADIYLLDDPLSSLDARVAEDIFVYCLRGLLADRIVLLTTNTSRYLREADYVIKLERGVIVEKGKLQEMKEKKSDMLSRYLKVPETNFTKSQLTQSHSMRNLNEILNDEKTTKWPADVLNEEKEHRETGTIPFKVYMEYFMYGAPWLVLLIVVLLYLFGQVFVVLVDLQVPLLPFLSKDDTGFHEKLMMYSLLLIIAITVTIFSTYCLLLIPVHAAYALHNAMVTSIMAAPFFFHCTNPVGRIMNRFSQDVNSLDELLPNYFTIFCLLLPPSIATVILASVTDLILIPFGIITFFVFFFISKWFFSSAIELKRLMSLARSPLYTHFSNTMEGAPIIRVYEKQKEFTEKVYSFIDDHNRALFTYYTAVRWFANTLDIISVIFSIFIISMVVYSATPESNEAMTTIVIFYAVSTSQITTICIRLFAEIRSQMAAVQRILEYIKKKPEEGRDLPGQAPCDWPHSGVVKFNNVSVKYYEDGPDVLRNLTFELRASEKIGVAGRTGAGKSTLVAALMRMAKMSGEIIVDNINIMKLNVASARRNISIISQSPILISGSLRLNLDPFNMFTDDEIWHALDQVQLKSVISNLPQQLDTRIMPNNSGFSVGEKQLFHIVRVLLQKKKIIIFDEATGKVDERTDEKIQRIIRGVFKDCTVITIAHRLSTILDCDRIMVFDGGEIAEFDKPDVLLEREDGLLKQLYDVTSGN